MSKKPFKTRYDRRIESLVINENWGAKRIYNHLMGDEKAVYGKEPISLSTIERRAAKYNKHRALLERKYRNTLTDADVQRIKELGLWSGFKLFMRVITLSEWR